MSARKMDSTSLGMTPTSTHCLTLPADAVLVRKNGIEFRNSESIPVWTEMTVSLQGPNPTRKVNFTGVVVACSGNRHEGFKVEMLFTHVSRLSQARLLAYS
ncbi:MAG: hypothetical protein ABSA83_10605 [Verrucomicrobiota bacterium]